MKISKRLVPILTVLLLPTCSSPCYHNNYLNVTDYEIQPDLITLGGVEVDTSWQEVNIIAIDQAVEELEECLSTDIRRECLTIKIAPDWYTSPCSGEQLFPCRISEVVCLDKGVVPTKLCPCNCRAVIQDETTIITTPNLLLLKAELARMITGVNNPWVDEEIAACL